MTSEGGPVVGVESLGKAEPPYSQHQVAEETLGIFSQVKIGNHDIACGIVQNGMEVGLPAVDAIFNDRPMQEVGAPEIAEVRILEGANAFGIDLDMTPQPLCSGETIEGCPAWFLAVPKLFFQ